MRSAADFSFFTLTELGFLLRGVVAVVDCYFLLDIVVGLPVSKVLWA